MTGEKHLRLLLCCLAWGTLFCLVIAWVAIHCFLLFASLLQQAWQWNMCCCQRTWPLGIAQVFFLFFPIDP